LKIDIVIPIYNEEENLMELYIRIRNICDQMDHPWRLIYVNDGSTDNSMKIMLEQCAENKNISVIDFSRNFGFQAAIAAGLSYSNGDAVIVMDGDLQDPPEVIPELLVKWKEGFQIIQAQRRSRQERGIRRFGFEVFHRLFSWISDFPIASNTGTFGLLDRVSVEEINRLTEKNRFFPGLRNWVGFKQGAVYYDRQDRASGEPKQTYGRLFKYAFDAIFSFSYKPLRIMTVSGIIISSLSFFIALFFVTKRLLGIEIAPTGFTTLVTLSLFLGGIQLIAIGLLGEYLARIYDEVKTRPLYIVNHCYGSQIEKKDNVNSK
jgi:dolichol-phosphate mannosyltransferase